MTTKCDKLRQNTTSVGWGLPEKSGENCGEGYGTWAMFCWIESASLAMRPLCSFAADRPSIALFLCCSISWFGPPPDRKTTGLTKPLKPEFNFGKEKGKVLGGQPSEKLNFGHFWSFLVIFGHVVFVGCAVTNCTR